MPRPTAAARATPVIGGSRTLQPPEGLGERECVEWCLIVDRLGADYFPREAHGLLSAFCAAKIQLDDVNARMATFPPGLPTDKGDWPEYLTLTKLRGALSGQLASLSTKLRISTQSGYPLSEAKSRARAGRLSDSECPWIEPQPKPETKPETKARYEARPAEAGQWSDSGSGGGGAGCAAIVGLIVERQQMAKSA